MIDYPFAWHQRSKVLLARTMFAINGDDSFNFRQFITYELERLDRENRKEVDDAIFRQRQGGCQVLADILRLLEGADEMFNTLKTSENQVTDSP